jgi:hypothetical protein
MDLRVTGVFGGLGDFGFGKEKKEDKIDALVDEQLSSIN